MRIFRKFLAVLLTVLTIMSVFSVATPVIAADVQSAAAENAVSSAQVQESAEDSVNAENEPFVIGEDETRRTENTKHFLMSDGTRKAVIYGNAVHYADANGKLREINNILSYDKDKKEYTNTQNSFKATFKESTGKGDMFTLENGGYSISWEYNAGLLRRALTRVEYEERKLSSDKISQIAEKSEDSITYKNIESDCELQYVVTNNGVKENIILNSPVNKNEFSFTVTAEGLNLLKNADGSISAKNAQGEEIFFIPAPFMFDSNDVYSYDASYEIEAQKDSYTITIVADEEWLKDEARLYPVTIDPVIYTKQTSTSVSSTFVTSDVPTANYGSRQDIYVGHESSNYGLCHALFKNTLPTLNKGDMVVGASLNIYMHSTSFDGGSSKRQLDAHIITSSWAENSVTWSTKPSYNATVLDYAFMNNGEESWKSFDITKAVKGWYEGSFANYGIMIKNHDETLAPARAIFRSENATGITEGIPFISITYRNNKGIESYWSYSGFSAGSAGVANVNDYTGNLAHVVPLASTVSEIMPVSLSMVYNAYCSQYIYTAGKNSSNLTSPGKGWRLNYQQTLLPSSEYGLTGESAENFPYVYADGDGTEHYIAKTTEDNETVYKDEDGLGYTFTKLSDNTMKLSQDDGSYMLFNTKGNLTQIVDNSGNKILLTYDSTGKKLERITDGTGHYYQIAYYRNSTDTADTDFIETITDNAGRVIRFITEDCLLKGVILQDTQTKAYFRYIANDEHLLSYVWCNDKNGLAFDYTTRAKASRIARVTEFSATGADVAASARTIGAISTFDRVAYNTTVIRSPGIDGINGAVTSGNGNDDIIATLQFDNFGRTVSQQVKYGNGEAVGAGAYTYTGDENEESRNRIRSSATLNKNTVNLLTNPNAEGTSGWTIHSSTGNVAYSYAADTTESYTGKQSLKLTNTSVPQAGYSYAGQRVNNIKPGYYYTFSAFVKTKNLTLANFNSYKGAYLMLVSHSADGTYLGAQRSAFITADTNETINSGWRRINATMKMPGNASYVIAYVILGCATGSANFDALQLEEGVTANSVNLLQNGSFEKVSTASISNWSNTDNISYVADKDGSTAEKSKDGTRSLKITGDGNTAKGFNQYVVVSPNENDTYILSGWAAAYSVNKSYHENLAFELAARVTYSCSDGSTVTQYKDSAQFNTTVAEWQYAASSFSLKYVKANKNDTKTYTPTHIMIMPRYNYQGNFAYFDNIQLIKDVAQSYTYDSEGNATSVSANAEQKNNMEYEGEDLKSYTDAAGYTTEYTYDTHHRLTQAKSPKEVKVNYSYNTRGQVTAVETVNKGGNMKIETANTYTGTYPSYGLSDGAYLYQTTDELGKTTTYGHDLSTGAQTSVTDAGGTKTTYGYNDNYTRLLKTQTGSTAIEYAYEGNRISQLLFKDTEKGTKETYSFTYDSFGNVINTNIGQGASKKSLVTNIYGTNNGVLKQSNYANGDSIRYEYSKAGLTTGIYQDNNSESASPAFTWGYSSNGLPRVHKDGYAGLRYDYSYDAIGRLIRTDISKSTSGDYVGATEYGYDLRNNLTSISNDVGGLTFAQYYRYRKVDGVSSSEADAKDNLPTQYRALEVNTNYTHDSLNRLSQKVVDTTSDIVTKYGYVSRLVGETTYYSHQLRAEETNGVSYHYAYDDVGNITQIRKGTGVNTSFANAAPYKEYSYDGKHQLESETMGSTKNTWVYDGLGNIIKRETTVNGTPTAQVTYNYGADSDCGWENLLTNITISNYTDNTTTVETIDYDEIGNPISY
ncbi:MAG: DNRLRE domain-containing protein, partial [Clostridia bacterium]|nr:DNRLRE domain-containing protein [Clostridia bacterium]